jgi:hypothetical protein
VFLPSRSVTNEVDRLSSRFCLTTGDSFRVPFEYNFHMSAIDLTRFDVKFQNGWMDSYIDLVDYFLYLQKYSLAVFGNMIKRDVLHGIKVP